MWPFKNNNKENKSVAEDKRPVVPLDILPDLVVLQMEYNDEKAKEARNKIETVYTFMNNVPIPDKYKPYLKPNDELSCYVKIGTLPTIGIIWYPDFAKYVFAVDVGKNRVYSWNGRDTNKKWFPDVREFNNLKDCLKCIVTNIDFVGEGE